MVNNNKHEVKVGFKQILSRDFYTWSFALMLLIPSFNYFINDIIQLYLGWRGVSLYFYGILSLLSVMTYIRVIKDFGKSKLFVLWAAVSAAAIFSYMNYPQIHDFFFAPGMDPLKSWFIYAPLFLIPMTIVSSRCVNWGLILRVLFPVSIVTIITGLLSYYLVVFQAGLFFEVNYMSYSYNMLLPYCCTLAYATKYDDIKGYAVSIMAFFAILLVGSRGAAAWAVLFLFMMIYERFKAKRHLIVGILLSVVLVMVAFSQFSSFSKDASSFLNSHDAGSRVLAKIEEGEFMTSEGRDKIDVVLTDAIWDNLFIGSGLFADRYYLKKNGMTGYAHNIVRELWCDFGVIFGSVILIVIIVGVFRLYKIRDIDFHRVFLILLPNGFFKLIISDSFLICLEFWAIIGLMFNSYSRCRIKKHDITK